MLGVLCDIVQQNSDWSKWCGVSWESLFLSLNFYFMLCLSTCFCIFITITKSNMKCMCRGVFLQIWKCAATQWVTYKIEWSLIPSVYVALLTILLIKPIEFLWICVTEKEESNYKLTKIRYHQNKLLQASYLQIQMSSKTAKQQPCCKGPCVLAELAEFSLFFYFWGIEGLNPYSPRWESSACPIAQLLHRFFCLFILLYTIHLMWSVKTCDQPKFSIRGSIFEA